MIKKLKKKIEKKKNIIVYLILYTTDWLFSFTTRRRLVKKKKIVLKRHESQRQYLTFITCFPVHFNSGGGFDLMKFEAHTIVWTNHLNNCNGFVEIDDSHNPVPLDSLQTNGRLKRSILSESKLFHSDWLNIEKALC